VTDIEVPSITAPSNKSVSNDAGLCTAVVALGTPAVNDNCGITLAATNNAPATFPVGTTSVTWTILDIYGNSNTAAQSVVVADDEDPTISAPSNVSTVADNGACFASGVALGTPAVNDNCGITLAATNNAPATFPVGTTSVTWTVLDIHGNSNTAAQSVVVADDQIPSITAPANKSVNTDATICTATVALGTPNVGDNCAVSGSATNDAPAAFPVGTTSVTWTVLDIHGNSNTAAQSVVVADVGSAVDHGSVEQVGEQRRRPLHGGGRARYSRHVNDNCGITLAATNNAPATFPVGTTSVTWTILDTHGNSNTAAQSVVVADDEDPTISAPSNVSTVADNGACFASGVALGTPAVNDNCGITLAATNNAPATFPVGTTSVTWTVLDIHGNSNTAAQSVVVADDQIPSITAPANKSVNTDATICTATVALGTPNVGDNCAVSGSATNDAPAAFPVGTTSVTWTVLDIHGNSNTAAQSVVVTDIEAPSITAPSNKSVSNDAGLCTAVVALGTPAVNDNCGITLAATNNAPATFLVGTTSVTWTILDIDGNSNTAAQSVVVADDEDPTISAPSNVSTVADNGACFASGVALGTPAVNDNCGITLAATNNAPATFPVGTTSVTWTVLDIHGNSNTAAQSVVVADDQIPSITAPANKSVNTDATICTATVALGTPNVGDNCAVSGSATNDVSGGVPGRHDVGDVDGPRHPRQLQHGGAERRRDGYRSAVDHGSGDRVGERTDAGLVAWAVAGARYPGGDERQLRRSRSAVGVEQRSGAVRRSARRTVTWTVSDIYGNSNAAAQRVGGGGRRSAVDLGSGDRFGQRGRGVARRPWPRSWWRRTTTAVSRVGR
jgi:hypothetical protein